MIDFLIGLVLILLIIRGVSWCVRTFWIWLAQGKVLEKAVEEERVGESIRGAFADAEGIRIERQLRGGRRPLLGVRDEDGNPIRLTREQRKELRAADRARREEFLEGAHISWYQLVIIFTVGSILGLALEEVWMFVTAGLTESRVGLIWGPFSPLYGFGACLMTLVAFFLRNKHAPWWVIFLVSAAVGGGLEQITGWSMETLFHATSWSYAHLPDHITQWVAWRFLAMWGFLGMVWSYLIMPPMLYRIGLATTRRQVVFVGLVAAYLALDVWMTLQCFERKAARDEGVPPQNAFQSWVDMHYTDSFIAGRFQNLVIEGGGSSNDPGATAPQMIAILPPDNNVQN